jgi:hypothetical protein
MKKRHKEDFRFPHSVECSIRGVAHGSAACQSLATFLIEQQRSDFDAQGHLFNEAADEFKKALKWAKQGAKP